MNKAQLAAHEGAAEVDLVLANLRFLHGAEAVLVAAVEVHPARALDACKMLCD